MCVCQSFKSYSFHYTSWLAKFEDIFLFSLIAFFKDLPTQANLVLVYMGKESVFNFNRKRRKQLK